MIWVWWPRQSERVTIAAGIWRWSRCSLYSWRCPLRTHCPGQWTHWIFYEDRYTVQLILDFFSRWGSTVDDRGYRSYVIDRRYPRCCCLITKSHPRVHITLDAWLSWLTRHLWQPLWVADSRGLSCAPQSQKQQAANRKTRLCRLLVSESFQDIYWANLLLILAPPLSTPRSLCLACF